ncbi:MAG TPA: penicillin-binding transpeptidase domain-containing protein, partial [Phenylobacterium sp.]
YDYRADAPIRIGRWSPQNFGGGHRGRVTVADALRFSINTVSVRLARESGIEQVAGLARRFGLAAIPDHPGPSIALGAYEVSLLELTSAYQVFQNAGMRQPPFLIASITDARGEALYTRPATAPVSVLGEYQAGEMVRMMQGVIASGTGRRAAFGRQAAGKTGTSQNFRDAWFVGFTPDWAVGVWVGNDNNRSMAGVTGGELPAAIWRRFMVTAHQGMPEHGFGWLPIPPSPPPGWSEPPPGWSDDPVEAVEDPELGAAPMDVAAGEPDLPPDYAEETQYVDEAPLHEPPPVYEPRYEPVELPPAPPPPPTERGGDW